MTAGLQHSLSCREERQGNRAGRSPAFIAMDLRPGGEWLW